MHGKAYIYLEIHCIATKKMDIAWKYRVIWLSLPLPKNRRRLSCIPPHGASGRTSGRIRRRPQPSIGLMREKSPVSRCPVCQNNVPLLKVRDKFLCSHCHQEIRSNIRWVFAIGTAFTILLEPLYEGRLSFISISICNKTSLCWEIIDTSPDFLMGVLLLIFNS